VSGTRKVLESISSNEAGGQLTSLPALSTDGVGTAEVAVPSDCIQELFCEFCVLNLDSIPGPWAGSPS
jgi:hypothetical protein